ENIIEVCKKKELLKDIQLKKGFEFSILVANDIAQTTLLYGKVFKTYPFPIFSSEYILQTMKNDVCYFGIKKDGKLVAISSAEMDRENLNAEMTDFATLPEYRGNNLSSYLLNQMEIYLIKHGFKTAYTIARAISYGMNITFVKGNYKYSGTLINNTNISGDIESMNVWYKNFNHIF
ncbi:MAG: putative beta-lysine N-acetyltransferase, partial [Candidatus Gastranaerophilales bacterium]|nr:putative beta-lysine N-acetyltransferase [Candidatus Gastranaerophilales bacterium]